MVRTQWLGWGLMLAAAGCGGKRESGDAMGAAKTKDSGMMSGMGTAAGSAEYNVVIHSRWTKANFPLEYPEPGLVSGPHFSGLIGTTHDSAYAIFREGTPPTPGLEHLSEEGKHNPLDDEIRSAIAAGKAGVLFESGALRDFNDSIMATFAADPRHPLVSVVAMVAPSPDWFTGVGAVNLMENGQWVAGRTLELYAWDSGGDDGTTYKAPDQDTNPKKPTMRALNPHFVIDGQARPVGSITFTRK